MDPWRALIEAFVGERIDGPQFETAFLRLHRDVVARGESVRFAVDQLFYEVDAFCADVELRTDQDIDEEQLRAAARQALLDWERSWPPIR